jgi:hypothetical protein
MNNERDEGDDGELFVPDIPTADQDGDTEEDEYTTAEDHHPLQRSNLKPNSVEMIELGLPKRLRPAKEPEMGLQTDEGFFVLNKLAAHRNADNFDEDDDVMIEDTPLQRSNLKRKSVEPAKLVSTKRVRFAIGPNDKPKAGKKHHATDQRVAEGDPDMTDDDSDFQVSIRREARLAERKDAPPELHNESPGESTSVRGQGTRGTRTRVQTQILGFLTRSWRRSDSKALAGYRELLRQELDRVEDALELAMDVELLLGLGKRPTRPEAEES